MGVLSHDAPTRSRGSFHPLATRITKRTRFVKRDKFVRLVACDALRSIKEARRYGRRRTPLPGPCWALCSCGSYLMVVPGERCWCEKCRRYRDFEDLV